MQELSTVSAPVSANLPGLAPLSRYISARAGLPARASEAASASPVEVFSRASGAHASTARPTVPAQPSPAGPTTSAVSDSIDTARLALRLLDYPAIDPFAASVASVVWASHHAVLTGKTEKIAVPEAFQKPIPVEVNLKNGKDAPMLVIFPGLGSTTITSQVRALKSQALDRGMNYTVMPNPWSKTWLGAVPKHAPGNLPWETQVTRDVLHALQKRHPGFYENVSAVGYSYGSLLGASVVAHDHDAGAGASTVQGSLVAISPPQNLCDSLQALDGLRTQYDPPHNVSGVLASYGAAVTYYGYDRIGESYVAKRQDTDVEKYLADTMASRDHLEQVLEHYHIPTNTSPSQQKQLSGAT